MNLSAWFPLVQRRAHADAPAPEAQAEPARMPGCGAVTARPLGDLASLCAPLVRDPFYRLRPAFSREAAELSLELAEMTYTLELEPWMEAGWDDFSIQIDNTLQSGISHAEFVSGERMRALIAAFKLHRAKVALRERNPVSQIMSALRQRERSDTIKAVCMMHELEDGRFLLAIGFMGTGRRFYDWISNFRFTTEEGFHKGFHQLCDYFEQGADSIVFPGTAQKLGLERLTLGDVISDMKSLNSRFRLWMAGHSQGAAVMQIFTHRLLNDWGVPPQNMLGVGFASPTVATGKLVYDPAAYPLYHILNSDDVVPRMGALLHLGLCLRYPSDEALRERCYRLSALPADVAARERLAPIAAQMRDTPSILCRSTAFLQCLAEEKGEEGLNNLMNQRWAFPALDRVIAAAGDKAFSLLDRLIDNAHNGHLALTGQPMSEPKLKALRDELRPIVKEIPFRRLMGAVAGYCLPPHHIILHEIHAEGPYAIIVKEGLEALEPFIWVNPKQGMPEKRFAKAVAGDFPEEAAPRVTRRRTKPKATRAPHRGKQRATLTARRQG